MRAPALKPIVEGTLEAIGQELADGKAIILRKGCGVIPGGKIVRQESDALNSDTIGSKPPR
jgi:hypothetical protein